MKRTVKFIIAALIIVIILSAGLYWKNSRRIDESSNFQPPTSQSATPNGVSSEEGTGNTESITNDPKTDAEINKELDALEAELKQAETEDQKDPELGI